MGSQILLYDAQPCDAGASSRSPPVLWRESSQDPLGICVVIRTCSVTKRVRRRDWTIAVSLGLVSGPKVEEKSAVCQNIDSSDRVFCDCCSGDSPASQKSQASSSKQPLDPRTSAPGSSRTDLTDVSGRLSLVNSFVRLVN